MLHRIERSVAVLGVRMRIVAYTVTPKGGWGLLHWCNRLPHRQEDVSMTCTPAVFLPLTDSTRRDVRHKGPPVFLTDDLHHVSSRHGH
jgi:hypothetical protein